MIYLASELLASDSLELRLDEVGGASRVVMNDLTSFSVPMSNARALFEPDKAPCLRSLCITLVQSHSTFVISTDLPLRRASKMPVSMSSGEDESATYDIESRRRICWSIANLGSKTLNDVCFFTPRFLCNTLNVWCACKKQCLLVVRPALKMASYIQEFYHQSCSWFEHWNRQPEPPFCQAYVVYKPLSFTNCGQCSKFNHVSPIALVT